MPTFVVDSTAIQGQVNRLKKINKSALPVAIRQTLNKAAYDVKQNTMPKESDVFIHRKPTFFKANSKVIQAQGFDVKSMIAEVGFLPKPNDKSHSVEDLEQQEKGGNIKGRAFIALPAARVGNSWGRNVRAKNRLEKMRTSIIDPRRNPKSKGRGKMSFILSARHAGVGGFVMNQDHTRLLEIKSIKEVPANNRWGKNTVVKSTIVDSIKKNRSAHVKATKFMQKASLTSAKKMESDFVALANKKIASLK